MKYAEKLKDSRWQKRRLQLFEASNWKCEHCATGSKPLHVHHLHYFGNTDPWDYADALLVVLCEDCHKERQEAEARVYSAIAVATRLVPGRRLNDFTKQLIPAAFAECKTP